MADNPYTNKVVYDGQVLIDLTGDTATAADVAQGKIFHLASGAQAIGTAVNFKPQIIVTAPTGSTVTATDGTTTLTATESGGTWIFDIPNYGTWTVTATLGAATASGTVSITEVKQYTMTLAYFAATLNITAPSGATVTVTKDGVTVNTHTATGSAVAVSVYEPGTYTVTATDGTNTATGSASITTDGQSVSISLSFAPPEDVNDATWAQISEVSQAGTGDTYWDVGDTKAITLNGNIGDFLTLNNKTVYVFILAFNHNSANGETQGILWGGFKTAKANGTMFALFDSKYSPDAGWEGYNDGSKTFTMNHKDNSNKGGWKGCDFRYDILGATETQPANYNGTKADNNAGYDATAAARTSPVANTLAAALPFDMRAALKLRTHYVDNVGNRSNVAANVTAVVDLISLMCEFEIFGARSYANQYEQNKQAQFAYFAAGNAHRWFKETATTTGLYVWEASPYYGNASGFCLVRGNGDANSDLAHYSFALAAAFLT